MLFVAIIVLGICITLLSTHRSVIKYLVDEIGRFILSLQPQQQIMSNEKNSQQPAAPFLQRQLYVDADRHFAVMAGFFFNERWQKQRPKVFNDNEVYSTTTLPLRPAYYCRPCAGDLCYNEESQRQMNN